MVSILWWRFAWLVRGPSGRNLEHGVGGPHLAERDGASRALLIGGCGFAPPALIFEWAGCGPAGSRRVVGCRGRSLVAGRQTANRPGMQLQQVRQAAMSSSRVASLIW
jgi:hypothetical protein